MSAPPTPGKPAAFQTPAHDAKTPGRTPAGKGSAGGCRKWKFIGLLLIALSLGAIIYLYHIEKITAPTAGIVSGIVIAVAVIIKIVSKLGCKSQCAKAKPE
jgi:hypothetical protein